MPFSFTIDTDDARRTLKALGAVDSPLRRAIIKQLRATAQEVKAEGQSAVRRAAGAGKVYVLGARKFGGSKKRNVKGGTAVAFHRASAPGEPPVIWTGTLSRRWGVGISRTRLSAGIFANAPHAHLLEFGTADRVVKRTGKRSGRVLPRPFLTPALTRRQDIFATRVAEAFDEVLN